MRAPVLLTACDFVEGSCGREQANKQIEKGLFRRKGWRVKRQSGKKSNWSSTATTEEWGEYYSEYPQYRRIFEGMIIRGELICVPQLPQSGTLRSRYFSPLSSLHFAVCCCNMQTQAMVSSGLLLHGTSGDSCLCSQYPESHRRQNISLSFFSLEFNFSLIMLAKWWLWQKPPSRVAAPSALWKNWTWSVPQWN